MGFECFSVKNSRDRRREKKQLEQNVNEQTTGISEKNPPVQGPLEELNYLDKTKSHFLADISHDFRTLLTVLQGTLEQILAEKTGEKFKDQIKMMLRNCSVLFGMVNQMLEQAKFESGNMKLEESSLSSMDTKFINEVKDVIEKNLATPGFGVSQIARKLYMSRSSLYKKIDALTGRSTQLFIRSYRLQRAAQLLKAGTGNVTEVAFAVGFSSAAYFTKCFKEEFHQLPSDY